MATTLSNIVRPAPGADYRTPSKHRPVGLAFAVIGLLIATVVLIAGIVAGNDLDDGSLVSAREILAWAFGLNTLALSTIKFGIAVILVGVLVRLWFRTESVKTALPALKKHVDDDQPIRTGEIDTTYGKATVTTSEPEPLAIHRMAQRMWAPMLAMGVMLVVAGFILSLVQSGEVSSDALRASQQSAWVQGLQFLGEGMILAGISFLLGSILGALRSAGGQVQESLGLPVKTLAMSNLAKAFVAVMMLGLMVEVFQFIAYIVVAQSTNPATIAANFAWLGPVRELGLGLLLSGIVLALATIGNALGFQFSRIVEIIKTGR
jgi:hypothetical protein